MPQRQREAPVVILGGGFGGLFTTYHLTAGAGREARAPVMLINCEEEFVFKPLLPEAVGGAAPPQFLTNNLPQLAKAWGFTFLQAEVEAVDRANQRLLTSEGEVPYRDLVVALGSVVDDHGIDLDLPRVFQLHGLDDGARLRAHIRKQVRRAVRAKMARTRAAALSFLSVGAGPTGIETLTEIQEFTTLCLDDACAPRLAQDATYTVIEAGDQILPAMAPRVRTAVQRILDTRGITVHSGTAVTEITKDGCRLADGRAFRAGTIVWAAGIRAHPLVSEMEAPVGSLGRVRVDNYLRPRGQVNVFALGDNAYCVDPQSGAPLPATGQVAVQQAKTVAANIRRRRYRKPLQVFRYTELGQLVPLGGGETAGYVLGRKVKGTSGWLASRAAYMHSVLGLDNRIGLAWGWGRQAMTQSLLRPLWR